MKTVAQVVDCLNELFISRNIKTLEYDFSREVEGKKVAFFNRMAFVSLDDVRHIANTVAPDEENYPDFTGELENWDSTKELEAHISKLEDGNLYWVLADKDTLRVMVDHVKDGEIESIFNLSLTIKENILS
uniref:Uncharacterized protein n=1 Tax=Myoviridae sp. ctLnO19 TaxID=2825085 RepID=A0A8S5NZR6_9CAUD|nr:MAG TPA: hypothetical protein [Myoviridae sp. ctLnO19]DAJ69122.1 MAG TPA: hypothetical protein [Caudoviricetes sp.]